jgi:hypothetical protein
MFLEKAEIQGIEQTCCPKTCCPENTLNAMKSRVVQTAFPSGEENTMRARILHMLHINRVYHCSAYRSAF